MKELCQYPYTGVSPCEHEATHRVEGLLLCDEHTSLSVLHGAERIEKIEPANLPTKQEDKITQSKGRDQ